MKYKNNPAKPLGDGEILLFIQQFWILADRMRKMLYYVQDSINNLLISASEFDESSISCGLSRRPEVRIFTGRRINNH
jgi:hypothetical protein